MSNEESNEAQTSTVLVHLEDAADTIGTVLQQYVDGEIDQSEMVSKANEAAPKLESVGCEFIEDSEAAYVNTKPVPENAESAVYFYRDENDTLKMTVRLLNYGDNEQVSDEEGYATIGEMAAFDVLRLVAMEHQSILEKVMMAQMFAGMLGGEEGDGEGDDPLASIEDPETREQVRKMTKH